jgi:hypothetical protein
MGFSYGETDGSVEVSEENEVRLAHCANDGRPDRRSNMVKREAPFVKHLPERVIG